MRTIQKETVFYSIQELKKEHFKTYQQVIERFRDRGEHLELIKEDFFFYLEDFMGDYTEKGELIEQITTSDEWDLNSYNNYSINWGKISHRHLMAIILKKAYWFDNNLIDYLTTTIIDRGLYVNYYRSGGFENMILNYYKNWDDLKDLKNDFNNIPVEYLMVMLEKGTNTDQILDFLNDTRAIKELLQDFEIENWIYLKKSYDGYTSDEMIEEDLEVLELEFDDEGNVFNY